MGIDVLSSSTRLFLMRGLERATLFGWLFLFLEKNGGGIGERFFARHETRQGRWVEEELKDG